MAALETQAPPPRYLGFVAGTFLGVTKNLVGHPFDTIKVRLQTLDGRFKGPMDCVWQTLRKEGIRGFYKGCTPPLVGWVAMDSVMLGLLHTYRRFLMDNVYTDQQRLPLAGHCLAGIMSGWTVLFVAAPVEQVKARLQVQYDAKLKVYTGPINCALQLLKTTGIRGLYKGLVSTMIFRTNFVFWWGSYELFTRWFETNTSMSTAAINFWSGGLLALVFWTFAYPADVVKQVVMTDSVENPRFKRWRDAARFVYETRGWRGFVRGFGPLILRLFPANAAALAAFEAVMRTLHYLGTESVAEESVGE